MPVYDLNDYIRSSTVVPGATMFTCIACGKTEPQADRHVCGEAGKLKRLRRRDAAAKRLNRIRAKLGRSGRVSERCDYCGRYARPGDAHMCLPDPRAKRFASPWLTSDDWMREAPPLGSGFHNIDPSISDNPERNNP